MQKKLIALAVAGLASTAAFGQVTVYGVMDGTFDSVSASSPVVPGDKLSRTNRVSANSSYVGVKGAEDLGGGNSALFQVEMGVGFDSAAGISASRDSFVGLKSDALGSVMLGNLTGPTRALGAAVDVFSGATGIGTNGGIIGKLGNIALNGADTAAANPLLAADCGRSATCVSTFDTRWKNALAYVSPTFAGVTATAVYVANENRTQDGAATQLNSSGTDIGIRYAAGPLMAAVTVNSLKMKNEAAVGNFDVNAKASNLRIGAKYDFGVVAVSGMVDQTKASDAAGEVKQRVYGAGVQVPVGAGKVVGQYYAAGDLKIDGQADDNTGAKLIALGYEHSLSKRTMVKAVYARLNNEDEAMYDFGVNAVGIGGFDGGGDGASVRGFSVGVRHSF